MAAIERQKSAQKYADTLMQNSKNGNSMARKEVKRAQEAARKATQKAIAAKEEAMYAEQVAKKTHCRSTCLFALNSRLIQMVR